MKSPFLTAAVALLSLHASPAMQAESVTLLPIADTSLNEAVPGANLGASDTLISGTVNTGKKARALLKFDLSASLPAEAVVTSVELGLDVVRVNNAASPVSIFGLHRMNVAWQEGTKSGLLGAVATAGEPCWNTRAVPDLSWALAGGAPGSDFEAAKSSEVEVGPLGRYLFPTKPQLVADVQGWIAHPESNFGWILITDSEGISETARRFGSKESAGKSPSLVVEFQLPTPEFRITRVVQNGSELTISWENGQASFQVQARETVDGPWQDVGPQTTATTAVLPISGAQRFYRVRSGLP